MFHPKAYLSFSQMTTFEMDPDEYVEQYINKERRKPSKNMKYGSRMATGLEKGEATGDIILDMAMAKIPKFELMDQPVTMEKGIEVFYERDQRNILVPALADGKEVIPLVAIPDTMKTDLSAFKEYKQSVKRWTQKRADDSGQISFYATAMWLVTGKVPEDIELVNVLVAYGEGGALAPTGEIVRLPTKRTMVDVIKMRTRIKNVWQGIGELCEEKMF